MLDEARLWLEDFRQHFMAFRWRDEFSEWSEWQETEVNVELPRFDELVTDNIQRYILPYAAHHDSLQFRFRYVDNYYFWIIDNVAILQTQANNIALDTGFFAIHPFAKIPADQVDEYFALAAVQNIGVEEQHNVQIHHTVKKRRL